MSDRLRGRGAVLATLAVAALTCLVAVAVASAGGTSQSACGTVVVNENSWVGSTANVYIVTLSERIARERNDPSLAITPGLWFRKGTPAMLLTLVTTTVIMWLFFDFFAAPLR